jgi:hypothetical protein
MRSLRSYQTTFQNPDYIQVNQKEQLRFQYLFSLSILLIVAAIFSFCLHTHFFKNLHYLFKIPIFSCLGVAVTFALGVSIIDIINLASHLIQAKDSRPLINASRQVMIVVII